MSTIVKFAGKSYVGSKAGVPTQEAVNLTALDAMSMAGLVELYNLVSSNLGRGWVKRFADTKAAIRRTWAILQEYDAQPDDDFQMSEEELAKQTGRPKAEAPVLAEVGNGSAVVQDTSQPNAFKVQLSDADKAQIAAEGAARKPAELPKSEQLLQAAAAARTAPSGRGNVWRRVKREEPSKIAYKPRPGTLQGQMYDGLTRDGGISMEDFCDLVEKSGSKDKMMYTPSGVWGGLRYLFVTLRGYGLDFDGKMLKLLVPADERAPQPLKGGNK